PSSPPRRSSDLSCRGSPERLHPPAPRRSVGRKRTILDWGDSLREEQLRGGCHRIRRGVPALSEGGDSSRQPPEARHVARPGEPETGSLRRARKARSRLPQPGEHNKGTGKGREKEG